MSEDEHPGSPAGDDIDVAAGADGAVPTAVGTAAATAAGSTATATAPGGIEELAARELGALDGAPLAAHAEAYSRVHAALQRELAEIDSA
jgi:hypothetical protein